MTASRRRSEPRPATRAATLPDGEDACWQAVASRSVAADDLFVFAVTTTGIYCRPSCPARRPHRTNVRFFGSAGEARAAGFRACKRCQPDAREGGGAEQRMRTAVIAACRIIDSEQSVPTLASLAARVGLSPTHLHRAFKRQLGLTLREYAAGRRAERARVALRTAPDVTTAIHAAGFEAASRYYAAAPEILGMTTQSYRYGGEGERIDYVVAPCALGVVLIAATKMGVCAVFLGDDREELLADLHRRFPNAQLVSANAELDAYVAVVVARIADPAATAPDLPLDLRGTAFQLRVWNALRALKPGTTTSYGALAQTIGAPRAVRAVAAACGANPVSILVPCHRVVGADGALTGYRWGVERKRRLLADEERSANRETSIDGAQGVVGRRKMR